MDTDQIERIMDKDTHANALYNGGLNAYAAAYTLAKVLNVPLDKAVLLIIAGKHDLYIKEMEEGQ